MLEEYISKQSFQTFGKIARNFFGRLHISYIIIHHSLPKSF